MDPCKEVIDEKKAIEEKLKTDSSQIFNFIKSKYGDAARHEGIDYEIRGEKATGKKRICMAVWNKCEATQGHYKTLEVSLSFDLNNNIHDIDYTRHLYHSLIPVSGILPVISDCAKNMGFYSNVYCDRVSTQVLPVSVTFGGRYTEEKLPEITKLIITIDDLLDFYLKKET